MSQSLTKLISLILSFCLILEQSLFAQAIDLSRYFVRNSGQNIPQSDKFRPLHLRYLGYDNLSQDFKILLDKGDAKKEDLENKAYIEENTQTLLKCFFVGLSLPNEKFWVNLRPDSPDNILDPDLEKTDIGRIFLEADLQLKKDASSWTSPQTPEGKAYWDKLYEKAGELFGNENITIPTITRPWIVPGEIIIREAPDNAYIYKATLKVMLEEDYLNQRTEEPKNRRTESFSFPDPRLKELNEYSTRLIKETIIPKLTYEVNTSKRYAPLRQVYYSLILAQWFKRKYGPGSPVLGSQSKENYYIKLIDSGDLTNLTSSQPYDKQAYFKQYQKSFKDGEYNLHEPVYTPVGQSIRRYISGGIKNFMSSSAVVVDARGDVPPKTPHCIDMAYPIKYPALLHPGEEFWFRIEEELRSVKKGDGSRKYFIDTKKEEVFYGKVKKYMNLARVGNHQGYDLVQIGDLFFIDKIVYEDLEKGLPEELKRKIISVPDLSQSIIGQSEQEGGRMKQFTAAAILSMLHSNIAGKCVIDVGAGDGMLALAAAKLGASKVILIDKNSKELDKARKNLENNGLKEKEDFWIIDEDLRDQDKITEKLSAIKLDDIFLVSNIGNWPLDYGPITNLTSLELILGIVKKRKARISGIVLGGYEAKPLPMPIKYGYKTKMDYGYKKHRPDKDITILKKNGFTVRPEKSRVGGCIAISAASSVVEKEDADLGKSNFSGFGDKDYPEILRQTIYLLQEEVNAIENIARSLSFFNKYNQFKEKKIEPEVFLRELENFCIQIERRKIVVNDEKVDFYFWNSKIEINHDLKDKPQKACFYLRIIIQNAKLLGEGIPIHKIKSFEKRMDSYLKLLLDIKNPFGIDFEALGTIDESLGQPQLTYMLLRAYQKLFKKNNDAPIIVSSSINVDKPGGIAFNALPVQTESVVSSALGALPGVQAFKGDLDAEWARIQAVFNAGIRPSAQRLADFAAAGAASPMASQRREDVLGLVAELLRRDEEDKMLAPTDPALKDLLNALESLL